MTDPSTMLTSRCDVLDLLEAALVTRTLIVLAVGAGAIVTGTPIAISTRDGDDWVTLAGGPTIAVSTICGAAPSPPAKPGR